ncbi:late competence development ComFB family protein [Alkalibacter sp. M17DMB]|nr:late competence development ComFB family protein [Alkalibacter mobilis]
MHLKNFTEILVDESINKLWGESTSDCRCDRCRLDVKAIALNKLPPKYTVTDKGEVFAKLNSFKNQVHVDVLKEVVSAMEIVKSKKSHD